MPWRPMWVRLSRVQFYKKYTSVCLLEASIHVSLKWYLTKSGLPFHVRGFYRAHLQVLANPKAKLKCQRRQCTSLDQCSWAWAFLLPKFRYHNLRLRLCLNLFLVKYKIVLFLLTQAYTRTHMEIQTRRLNTTSCVPHSPFHLISKWPYLLRS